MKRGYSFVEASYGWIFLLSENIEKAMECI
jgi:hypothetical protein